MCVLAVRERLRLDVRSGVHQQEEWLFCREQQTVVRLWLSAARPQGSNKNLLTNSSCTFVCDEQIKIKLHLYTWEQSWCSWRTLSVLLFLQAPISCNATVHMTETEIDTKQVDCFFGEWRKDFTILLLLNAQCITSKITTKCRETFLKKSFVALRAKNYKRKKKVSLKYM